VNCNGFVNDKHPGSTFSLPLLEPSTAGAEGPIGPSPLSERRPFQTYGPRTLDAIPQLRSLPQDFREAMRVVARVFPFRVNSYVVEELIDWSAVPDDPLFQLTFPQPGMLVGEDFERLASLLRRGAPEAEVSAAARGIQMRRNPHPAGQRQLNVPRLEGSFLPGTQHKYAETVLFFPAQGQTCHSYCTYCFRWAQFVGLEDLKFASSEVAGLIDYLAARPEVTDVLFTGGDPLVMRTAVLRRYLEPLLAATGHRVTTIRIGTKAPAFWPQRFVSDSDADDLLRLFEKVVKAGFHLALMAHYSHPRELGTPVAREALRRILSTGAVVRCQAPLIRHVNDDARAWAELWRTQVRLGAVPYYLFVERDTGPRNYFEVPLARAWTIFRDAYQRVSGLARTVRGPSMSATPGKVVIDGVTTVRGQTVFALRFLQARDPEWVGRPFFAQYDPQAAWLTQLRPAFGESEFFFERPARQGSEARVIPLRESAGGAVSGPCGQDGSGGSPGGAAA
jgi:KamA family protein